MKCAIAVLSIALTALPASAAVSITCDQIRALHQQVGMETFRRMVIEMGFNESQVRAVYACLGGAR